jgi:predicted ATPase
LTRGCPRLVVLATSRERLGVRGEYLWPVAPLAVPADDAASGATTVLLQVPSVRLFCDRATAADPSFRLETSDSQAVVRICRRLDGLPLALELAAARAATLDPAELAERLGERFALLTAGPRDDTGRHRTLRATIDWSYELLEPAEAALFDRLSVFPGGFDLRAVEAVCGTAGDEDLVQHLVSLVDKSMVSAEPVDASIRYRLLETLHDYAGERLAGRGDTDARGRAHAQFYVQLAEDADRDVCGRNEARGVARLDRELDNLRAAHQWAIGHRDADLALRLSAALHFYAVHRLRDDVLGWAFAAAALPTAAGHRLRATACASAGFGAAHRGERAAATRLAVDGMASATDTSATADVYETLAVIAIYEGRLADSRRYGREAVLAARRAGDMYRAQWSSHVEALAAVYARDQVAPVMVESVHAGAVALGNPTHLAWAWYLRGEAVLDTDPDQALAAFERAVELAEPVRNSFVRGVALVSAGSARGRSADPWSAVGAFREIVCQWREAGDWTHQWTTLRNLVDLLVRLEVDEPAAVLLGAASAAASAQPVFGVGAERLARAERVLRARLGATRFDDAAERGSRTGDDDLVTFVLDELDRLRTVGPAAPDRVGHPVARTGRRSPTGQ